MQDKVGAATTLTLNAAYSYHIYLDKGMLGLGARFGVYNVKFDASDLSTSPLPSLMDIIRSLMRL